MKLKVRQKEISLSVSLLDGIVGENNITLHGLPVQSHLKVGNGPYEECWKYEVYSLDNKKKRECTDCRTVYENMWGVKLIETFCSDWIDA